MQPRSFAPALALLLAAGCREPGEREADELARLRDDAAAGVEAVEKFCTARDTALAQVERGVPGAERILEEVLLAPVVLDDYCEEFRYHGHEDESHEDAAGAPPPGERDTTAVDRAVRPAG